MSYDATDLDEGTPSGRRNVVRLLLSDTSNDPATEEFADDEIDYFLASSSGDGEDVYAAAISAARSAVTKYARLAVSRQVGDLSIDARGRAEEWRKAVSAIEAARADRSPGLAPLIGQDVESAEYEPVFSLAMHDNPREAEVDETSST